MTFEILLEAVKMAAMGAGLILATALWLAWPFCLWERLSGGSADETVLVFLINFALTIFFITVILIEVNPS